MCEVITDNRRFVSLKSTNGEYIVIPYSSFCCKDVPTDPKVFLGDTWISIDWYSLKFHNSLPKAWSRVEEETAEPF